MSIWIQISDFFNHTAGSALNGVIEAVRTVFEGDPETRRRVAFSVAMIALSAKMAKADGIVSSAEVDAFQQIFEIPRQDARQVSMLFNLAKQDVAGFEAYAEQLANLCSDGEKNCPMLRDIIDGLFHIAKADDLIHEAELAFLGDVAAIFGIDEVEFDQILSRHVDLGANDPYRILGLVEPVEFDDVRKHYLNLVREHHPDMLTARGLPLEFVKIANDRLAAINAAYERIEKNNKHKREQS
ncbi:MAG: DnaJ family molecular chaperone [Ahrensia sp.]|nr:DnaJ family molecular chaperone [Ahrensia sp.]